MNSILLKKLLVPFVFFFSLIATGQQEIKGRVVDAEGVRPLYFPMWVLCPRKSLWVHDHK
jgi:hypothetical protein